MQERTSGLVTGRIPFVGDHVPEGTAHLVFARSTHAHADISVPALDAVAALPGVIGVLTGADIAAAGIGDLPVRVRLPAPDGGPMACPPYPLLARDRVRHVGDPILAVVAETRAAALGALDHIAVDYAPLSAAATIEEAIAQDAPAIWPEIPGNLLFVEQRGDWTAIEAALTGSAHRTSLSMRISRVTAAPIETRCALAVPEQGRTALHVPTQTPHLLRRILAESVLHCPPESIRVVVPAVGGGFGMKGSIYPEYAVAIHAAQRWKRPILWVADRSESMVSDHQGRDALSEVELGFDAEARLTAIRWRLTGALGAYLAFNGTHTLVNNLWGVTGLYRVPVIAVESRGVVTNAPPIAPYRGAGRPEATLSIERTLDLAARELGLDAWDLRRRNLLEGREFPHRTALGLMIDSADPAAILDVLERRCGRSGFEERRSQALHAGKLRGLGLACFMEVAAGPPLAPQTEALRLSLTAPDTLVIEAGSIDAGQGHGSLAATLVSEAIEGAQLDVDFRFGDTASLGEGTGTFGSRTAIMLGLLIGRGCGTLLDRLRATAAEEMEVAAPDVVYSAGTFAVAGTDLGLDFRTVASLHLSRHGPIVEEIVAAPQDATFPNGAHAAEVEIDPETGAVALIGYWAVDDVGRPLDHDRIAAQIHGGVAQGFGQAVLEQMTFEPGTGQPLSGSLMDYALPRAQDLPMIDTAELAVPSTNNPLGVKGVGEAGTVGALSAVINAVHDALGDLGIRHLDCPLKPERIWTAIVTARRRQER